MLSEWLGELPEEDRKRRITEAFSKVAATEDGKIVFHVIFENLYFIREAKTPEHQVLNNYAKFLLKTYFGEDAIYRVMEALLKQKEES